MHNNLEHLHLFENKGLYIIKKHICSCEKSKCVKKYCECYSNGETCGSKCGCINCINTIFSNTKSIVNLNTLPIPKIVKTEDKTIMCTCTKSSCSKNYCDCYKFNQKCTSRCRCIDCKNTSNTIIETDKSNKESVEYTRIEISSGIIHVENGNINPLNLRDFDKKGKFHFKVTQFNDINKSDSSEVDAEEESYRT